MSYFELHCKTNFSFLEGAAHADELVERAAELGYQGLAVTDVNSLAGVVRAHLAARQASLPLLIGAELRLEDAARAVVWVTDRASYGRLARLITKGRRQAPKGECRLTFDDLAEASQGLLAGILPPRRETAPAKGASPAAASRPTDPRVLANPQRWLSPYRELLGDRCYLLAEAHRGVDDRSWLEQLAQLAKQSKVPLVAAGDVHYDRPRRAILQDVLTAIRERMTVEQAEEAGYLLANAQRHLRSREEIDEVFAGQREAVERTRQVAERCHFSLAELRYEYPEELAPAGMKPGEYLATMTWKGARKRYPQGVPGKVRQLLEHELHLIDQLGYEAYFLTVFDLVRFARRRDILCQGRGSAANSAVCFCLGITSVDPATTDVLFERFVSKERDEAPDIDVDFEHERREEVLQYLYDKYGRERAGLTATVITYRCRSAIRDAGKALGLSLDCVDAVAKQVEGYAHEDQLAARCRQAGLDPESPLGERFLYVVEQLTGFPRHLSQHVGGMVITQGPLCELAPIENAAMADRTVIQWDKNDLEELGILKVDCLALGMLTAIHRCFEMVRQHTGRRLSLASIPADDAEVYDMMCRADTIGVFQIESRAQMSMLPRLRPRCYYDLVIEVAIVRPGPIQGQMVHPYLRRRAGKEEVEYPNQEIREVLEKTLGVPIFQEQAMRLAVVAAGFTPGEADQLRRAMGAWRRSGVIDKFRLKLLTGMRSRGLSEKFADQVFRQIRGFGEYGFPESHAASFALLVYVSAWLKHYYPAAFCAALINSQPMGFYAPAQLVRDARDHGVPVRPVDVNHSGWDCSLEAVEADRPADTSKVAPTPKGLALRLGLRMISRLSASAGEAIEAARKAGPFHSLADFRHRTQLRPAVLSRLAGADAFGSLGYGRRTALWDALAEHSRSLPLFDDKFDKFEGSLLEAPTEPAAEPPPQLPSLSPEEEVFADYQAAGLSLRGHPLAFYRKELDQLRVTSAKRLQAVPDGRHVRVSGLVLLRQRPSTAKGITFVTLEDETGTVNLVVKQKIWDRYYPIARRSPVWLAHGQLQVQEQVIHVVVHRLEDLSSRLGELKSQSRDFR